MVERRILKWTLAGMLVLGMVVPVAAHEVGWILMLPPISGHPSTYQDARGSLSEWEVRNSFDTARDCEAFKERVRKRYAETAQTLISERFTYGRCVPASVVYPHAEEK